MSHWDYCSWCGPCLCGKGTFRVRWESENYPPFRQFFDSKISCPECDQTYYLAVHSLTDVRVSRKCDHAARGAAVTARNAIWNSDRDVLALRVRLRLRLDAMPNQAARYRWLREHGLYGGCLAYFRRDYRDQPDMVVEQIVTMQSEAFPSLAAARQRCATVAIPEVPIHALDKLEWRSEAAH